MALKSPRTSFFALALLAVIAAAVFVSGAQAAIVPLRSGTAVSRTDAGVFMFIKAVDAAGKEFWVLTSICTIGEKGRIAVLAGTHHDKLKTDLHGVIEDVYIGEQVKIGDAEVVGFGAHGLPNGCVMME
jgi:hypothetical protein